MRIDLRELFDTEEKTAKENLSKDSMYREVLVAEISKGRRQIDAGEVSEARQTLNAVQRLHAAGVLQKIKEERSAGGKETGRLMREENQGIRDLVRMEYTRLVLSGVEPHTIIGILAKKKVDGQTHSIKTLYKHTKDLRK